MILLKFILLPYNLLIELIKYAEKIHDRNIDFFPYLYRELKDRIK